MLFSTIGQLPVFLWMMGAGALIAAWYAALAALRRLLRAGPWLSLAADVAFGAGAAVLFCGALVLANYGQPRLFAVLGTALGFALFAAAFYGPGLRLARAAADALRHNYVRLKQNRWIKVIFR